MGRGYIAVALRTALPVNSYVFDKKIINTPSMLGPQKSILIIEKKDQSKIIDHNNPASIVNKNFQVAEDIAEHPTEIFGIFDKTGEPVLSPIDVIDEYGEKFRTRTYLFGNNNGIAVNIPPSVLVKMKDNIWTHNHPNGWSSFSPADFCISAQTNAEGAEIRHSKEYLNNIQKLATNKQEMMPAIKKIRQSFKNANDKDMENIFKHMEQELDKMTVDSSKQKVVEQMSRNGKWHNELNDFNKPDFRNKIDTQLYKSFRLLFNNYGTRAMDDESYLLMTLGLTKHFAEKYNFNHVIARV